LVKLLAIIVLLTACGAPADHNEPAPAGHRELLHTVQDENGFVETVRCDSLLFSGLLGSVPNVDVDLLAARDEAGQWFRRPTKDCLATSRSKSTISRDMLVGVLWWSWRNDRLDVIEDLIQYASDHDFVMGQHDGSLEGRGRVILSPALAMTMAKLRLKLGGADSVYAHTPLVWPTIEPGFQRHLQVLHILLRAELDGGVSAQEASLLATYVKEEPGNLLWQAAARRHLNHNATGWVKLADKYPLGRLPSARNEWCDEWPVQRSANSKGQLPCPESTRIHSGGELLFAITILNGKR
jgi:hypothetical protein